MEKEHKKIRAQRVIENLLEEGVDVDSALQRAAKGVAFREGHTEAEKEKARELVFDLRIIIKRRLK